MCLAVLPRHLTPLWNSNAKTFIILFFLYHTHKIMLAHQKKGLFESDTPIFVLNSLKHRFQTITIMNSTLKYRFMKNANYVILSKNNQHNIL